MRYTIYSNDLTNVNGLIDKLHRTQWVTFIDPYDEVCKVELIACNDGYMIVDTNVNMLLCQGLHMLRLVPYYSEDILKHDIAFLYNFTICHTTPKELDSCKPNKKKDPENIFIVPIISW